MKQMTLGQKQTVEFAMDVKEHNAALADVNAIRAERGMKPIPALIGGELGDSRVNNCVIAVALNVGSTLASQVDGQNWQYMSLDGVGDTVVAEGFLTTRLKDLVEVFDRMVPGQSKYEIVLIGEDGAPIKNKSNTVVPEHEPRQRDRKTTKEAVHE